jgi:hypothetical protein
VRLVAVVALASSTVHADPVTLDARAGWQWLFLEGDATTSDLRGNAIDVAAAYAFGPRIGLAAGLEAARYGERSDRLPAGATATSAGAVVELRLDTNPDGPVSARIDLGTGYRWLSLPLAAGPTDRFHAWEPLHLRVGPAWRATPTVQLALQAGFGFGFLVARNRDGACSVTASCADSLYDSDAQSSVHFIFDVTAAVRVWL